MSKAFDEDESNRKRDEILQKLLRSQSKADLIMYQVCETLNAARRTLKGAEELCIQLTIMDKNLPSTDSWMMKIEAGLHRLQSDSREYKNPKIQNQLNSYAQEAATVPDLETQFKLVIKQSQSKYGLIWTNVHTLSQCLTYIQERQPIIDALNEKLVACQSALAKVKVLQDVWNGYLITHSRSELEDTQRLAAGVQWLSYRLRADAVIAEQTQLRAYLRSVHERLISPSFLELDTSHI